MSYTSRLIFLPVNYTRHLLLSLKKITYFVEATTLIEKLKIVLYLSSKSSRNY